MCQPPIGERPGERARRAAAEPARNVPEPAGAADHAISTPRQQEEDQRPTHGQHDQRRRERRRAARAAACAPKAGSGRRPRRAERRASRRARPVRERRARAARAGAVGPPTAPQAEEPLEEAGGADSGEDEHERVERPLAEEIRRSIATARGSQRADDVEARSRGAPRIGARNRNDERVGAGEARCAVGAALDAERLVTTIELRAGLDRCARPAVADRAVQRERRSATRGDWRRRHHDTVGPRDDRDGSADRRARLPRARRRARARPRRRALRAAVDSRAARVTGPARYSCRPRTRRSCSTWPGVTVESYTACGLAAPVEQDLDRGVPDDDTLPGLGRGDVVALPDRLELGRAPGEIEELWQQAVQRDEARDRRRGVTLGSTLTASTRTSARSGGSARAAQRSADRRSPGRRSCSGHRGT